MHRLKQVLMALFLIVLLALSGLAVSASSMDKKQPADQSMAEIEQFTKSRIDAQIAALDADLHEKLIIQAKFMNTHVETWTEGQLKQGSQEVNDYSSQYKSVLENTKQKLLDDDVFDTYQQEKEKEIEKKMAEALDDLLD